MTQPRLDFDAHPVARHGGEAVPPNVGTVVACGDVTAGRDRHPMLGAAGANPVSIRNDCRAAVASVQRDQPERVGPSSGANPEPSNPTRPAVRATDPDTSRAGWESMGSMIGRRTFEVFRVIEDAPAGMTNHEIALAVRNAVHNVSPRVAELRHEGWIEDSGERRPGPTGRPQIVWRALVRS